MDTLLQFPGVKSCPKSGGDPRYEECGDSVQDKCSNFGGQHRASYGGCEVREKAMDANKLK